MDASEIYSKRLKCERCDISQTRIIYFSSRRWTNQTPWRRSRPENIHLDTAATNSRRQSRLIFLENQKGLFHHLTTHFRMPVKRLMIFGPHQDTSYTATTLNPESKLHSPREEQFPVPLEYIDVSRTTHTNLDVKLEKAHRSTDLSDSCTGFHSVHSST